MFIVSCGLCAPSQPCCLKHDVLLTSPRCLICRVFIAVAALFNVGTLAGVEFDKVKVFKARALLADIQGDTLLKPLEKALPIPDAARWLKPMDILRVRCSCPELHPSQ